MSGVGHDPSLLGAYVLGVLDDYEATNLERHLSTCAQCRWELSELAAARNALDAVPPEAFLDGPPEGGDVLLQRTLRRVRAEEEGAQVPVPSGSHTRRAKPRRGRFLVAASVVVIAASALGGGVILGRQTAPPTFVAEPSQQPNVPGVRVASGTDKKTGASMQVKVTPAAGWVRVHAEVAGVRAGAACELRVVPRNGKPMVAGSWLVSDKGEREGTSLDGAALVDPSQVAAVDVVTLEGEKVISVGL